MKSNYVTPQVILKVFSEDVITASTPETIEGFDKSWITFDRAWITGLEEAIE